jgi:dihydroorotase
MPGVETALPLMLTQMQAGRCTLAQLLRWMCTGPAEAYGIAHKGRIVEGWDADLTLVDPEQVRTVHHQDIRSKARWSPYHGWKLSGWPVYTVVGGRVVYDHGRIRDGVRGQALQFN